MHTHFSHQFCDCSIRVFYGYTVHIALDEQTVENGGLHFVPGSHRYIMDIYILYSYTCYDS